MVTINNISNIYQQYTYSYPHKHAYRALENSIDLKTVWRNEDQSNLFGYLHLPFCEMRCGFCNLFTIANPKEGIQAYLNALQREALTYQHELPSSQFEAYAIGGGTPTFLEEDDFEKLLSIFKNDFGVNTNAKYGSIEASPKSITSKKINLIENYGINRVSMGIQSWIEEETKSLGRPQTVKIANEAANSLATSKIPEVNLDLIYGINGQTKKSWLYSLEKTIDFKPTEIFLYPLYTRPLTGLSKMNAPNIDERLSLFRIGRDFLKMNDYKQISMRCFRRNDAIVFKNKYNSVVHGMIGIGAGARSYTNELHYSSNYAVSRKATQAIISAYSNKSDESFKQINYGIYLNKAEQLRRFIIKSLIDGNSLDIKEMDSIHQKNAFKISFLQDLLEKKYLEEQNGTLQLTELGMELEDLIGPALFSKDINMLIKNFELN